MSVRVLSDKINSAYEADVRAQYSSVAKRLSTLNEALLNHAGARRVPGTSPPQWVWLDETPASAVQAAELLTVSRGKDLPIRSLINAHRAAQNRLVELAPKIRELELVRRLAG